MSSSDRHHLNTIPITHNANGNNKTSLYSLKFGEDVEKRLKEAKVCYVEIMDGRPAAIVIDDYRATLSPSADNQRVELATFDKQVKNQLVIEGSIHAKLSLIPDKLDTAAIRRRTEQAEKQRSCRKTVNLDTNHPNESVKMQRVSKDVKKKVIASRTSNDAKSALPVEDQLIHLLAVEDMTIETLSLKLGCNKTDIQNVLEKVAIPNGLLFKLKPALHYRVDHLNWPRYSVKERQLVSRRLGLGSVTCTPAQNLAERKVELSQADITRLADQRVRQMMKSTKRKR
jgi:hypothetical protein